MMVKAMGSVLAGAVAFALVASPAMVEAQTASSGLGVVRLTRAVMADGKMLPAGSYSLRVSSDAVTPVKGQAPANEQWVEFLQGGKVVGRELASVVPAAEAKGVIKGKTPAARSAKVELLKGGEYLRVWANQGGNQYLIHLVVGS